MDCGSAWPVPAMFEQFKAGEDLLIWFVEAGVGHLKSDPVSLDTVSTTMTAAKEAGHARQATEVHDSWQ
jgi:hypothetical protein